MIRALVIEPAGGLWGSERALLDLIEAASDLDIAVCCPPDTPLQGELERRGIPTFPYFVANLHQKSRWRRIEAALGVMRACLAFRPNVIHLNQSGAYRVSLPAATLLDLPIICHVRIFEDAAYLARQHPAPRRVKGLIAISGAMEAEIRSLPALQTIPLHRIYDAYAPSQPGPDTVRVPGRIACVGRVVAIKGQDLLLQALSVADGFPETVECLIVGDGDDAYVRSLQGLVQRAGVKVEWLGFVRDVAPLLRTCAVLVCPSHREPLGRVIFEAWDAGVLPVVYSGAGGSAEIVSAADGGILYVEQTPAALARALATALALGDSETARLVENGRAWMAAHCGAGPYGRAILAVFAGASTRSKDP